MNRFWINEIAILILLLSEGEPPHHHPSPEHGPAAVLPLYTP